MSSREWHREYGSHAEFYEHVYGQHVASVHRIGSGSVAVIDAVQSAGDWSDAPTPDLTIACLTSEPVGFAFDLGAGRFTGTQQKHDSIVIAPGAGGSILLHGAHRCRGVAIPYAWAKSLTDTGGEGLPPDGDFGHLHSRLIRDGSFHRILDAVWREARAGAPHGTLYSDGLVLQLLGLLLHLRDRRGGEQRKGGLAPWQVRRVSEYLDDHLAEDVSLADLGELLGLSPFHLCRAFKQSTGLPPHRWRQQRRMERARALLESTTDPVTEIAAAIGYGDPSQFAAAFRKSVGVTPTQYRRERRS